MTHGCCCYNIYACTDAVSSMYGWVGLASIYSWVVIAVEVAAGYRHLHKLDSEVGMPSVSTHQRGSQRAARLCWLEAPSHSQLSIAPTGPTFSDGQPRSGRMNWPIQQQ